MILFRNNYFRFFFTLVFTVLYSLFRESEYSTIVKPLPIIYWLFVATFSPKINGGYWLVGSLLFAFIGDILLDVSSIQLTVSTIPFLLFTALLAVSIFYRFQADEKKVLRKSDIPILILIVILVFGLLFSISDSKGPLRYIQSGLALASIMLLWNGIRLMTKKSNDDPRWKRNLAFIGILGIIGNYVLYALNLKGFEVSRDLVIQIYYWGQAMVAWSFLKE